MSTYNGTRVAVVGYGLTGFGRVDGASIIDLATSAATDALFNSGVAASDVDSLVFSTFASSVLGGQNFPAAVLASRIGLRGKTAYAVEAACASGSVALRRAVDSVRLGDSRIALVVGAEKMTSKETTAVTEALACASDTASGSYRAGLTFPGFFALLATSYLNTYGIHRELLADVSVKNRRHGVRNPHAQFRTEITREDVLASRMISDPLRLLDCSPISDGGAAVVVTDMETARRLVRYPVEVLACEQTNGPAAAEQLDSFVSLPSVVTATHRAFECAGLGPADVCVAEVHDCFSIAEWIALEDLGLVQRGEASAATSRGVTTLGGRIPVNPSGGLLSKGHPIGATGIAQVVEIVRQLRGEADNQVEAAQIGLTHNVGGTGGLASVTILKKVT